ncbi:MAG: PAS domain S-box protein, partial [Bacteroidia bacterium]
MFKKGNFVLMNMKGEITTDGIFDALFKNSRENTIIILSKEGTISDVNKAFCQKFGYSPSDVIGKYFNIFFNDRDIQKGLPEQELEEVKEKGSAEDNNYLVNKDGTETWVSGESILVKNDVGDEYILKIIQNIHPIKELQHTLKKEYEFSHNIIMSINDSLIVIDDKYNIHKYNNSFCTLFNWKVDNKNLKEDNFILFNEHNFIDALDNLLLRGKESEVEINYNDKILLVKLNSLTEKYNPKRYLILIQDISDKVNSDKQKDDMIAFVAHELRNPMSSII